MQENIERERQQRAAFHLAQDLYALMLEEPDYMLPRCKAFHKSLKAGVCPILPTEEEKAKISASIASATSNTATPAKKENVLPVANGKEEEKKGAEEEEEKKEEEEMAGQAATMPAVPKAEEKEEEVAEQAALAASNPPNPITITPIPTTPTLTTTDEAPTPKRAISPLPAAVFAPLIATKVLTKATKRVTFNDLDTKVLFPILRSPTTGEEYMSLTLRDGTLPTPRMVRVANGWVGG